MKPKTLIIAEAGVNHNGDLGMAKKLIEAAAAAGADLVKFQTFTADRLVTRSALKADYQVKTTGAEESQHAMLRKLELSEAMHHTLVQHCKECGIGFFSTAFDIESIDFLATLQPAFYKIPSGEITNLPYLRHIAKQGVPIILSTGMSTMGDIEAALNALEKAGSPRAQISVLHCTTEYPTPMVEVNLRAMQSIGTAFNVAVGYSDHTVGIEVAIAAVALGARVIEKHFTLDRNLPGPDHKASLEPAELSAMVRAIRNIEIALGDGVKRLTPSEERNQQIGRKSVVAKTDILKGEKFTTVNLACKRPGTGMSPMNWDKLLETNASQDYSSEDLININS